MFDDIIMKTRLPQKESHRLKVLWQYEVLDTVPEEIFDDLTELAARICESPIALISLVDESRQWFKSKVGITQEETSRDISFCAYAITQSNLFIVPDASKDARFAKNPLVTGKPGIRFYAGAPLITPDGYALGTLCVIDMKPRNLRADQRQALTVLARHIVSQLELRKRTRELTQAKKAEKTQQSRIEYLEKKLQAAEKKLEALRKTRQPRLSRKRC